MPLAWRDVRSSDGPQQYLWALIDFRGPALQRDLRTHTYPTYSFFDLLQSQEQIDAGQSPAIDPARFRDKIVFVGATASGLRDVFETPFAHGIMAGIHVHAAVADEILSVRWHRSWPHGGRRQRRSCGSQRLAGSRRRCSPMGTG